MHFPHSLILGFSKWRRIFCYVSLTDIWVIYFKPTLHVAYYRPALDRHRRGFYEVLQRQQEDRSVFAVSGERSLLPPSKESRRNSRVRCNEVLAQLWFVYFALVWDFIILAQRGNILSAYWSTVICMIWLLYFNFFVLHFCTRELLYLCVLCCCINCIFCWVSLFDETWNTETLNISLFDTYSMKHLWNSLWKQWNLLLFYEAHVVVLIWSLAFYCVI